jgi:hypothetical protein
MSSDTPAMSRACVTPGASFTTKVMTAHTTSITTAARMPMSMVFFVDLPETNYYIATARVVDGRRDLFFRR